jgi:hypothetical protein
VAPPKVTFVAALRRGGLFGWLFPALLHSAVLINEVAFDQPSGSPDWVELHNSGPDAVSVDGWALDDGDAALGNHVALAVPVPLPARAILVVYVDATGADDFDFSDGAGAVYSGTATTVALAATEDQAALYSSTVLSSSTIVDFVAWFTDDLYDGAADRAQVHAVAAGLWPADGVVPLDDTGNGYSLGRRRDGADGNTPGDFQYFQRPTPGASNEPPPSPYPAALAVDPARRAFSPYDPDPDFQYTRLYFNTAPEAVKTLRVYDTRGRVVRTLIENDQAIGAGDFSALGTGSVVWDGRDDGGAAVSIGVYVAGLEAADPATGTTQRARAVVAVGRPK